MSYEGSNEEEELEIVPIDNKNNNVNVVSDSNSDSSDEVFKNNEENFFDEDINDQVIALPITTVNAKVIWAKLQALYNDGANKIIKEVMQVKVSKNLNFLIVLAMVTTETMPVPEEPVSFNEAWNHSNATSSEKWQEAICKEFTDMNKQQVWRKTSKSLMPPNQCCVKNKWVFKIKCNGVYQMHLIACGYSQVPGIDFLTTLPSIFYYSWFYILVIQLK